MLSDHMLRQMVDAMPMPVFVQDENDHFVYVNRAYETLFAVRADSLTRSTDDASAHVDAHRRRLSTGQGHVIESTTFATPNGECLTMGMIHTQTYAPSPSAEVEAVKAELREVRSELARMRETDPVTQALSRRALRAHTEDVFGSASTGVLRISVDDLDAITDQFGQDVGDELLAGFGDIVRSNTRPSDVFVRIDESEFTLVLREANREQTAIAARRICAAVTEARTLQGMPQLALSVSVGAAFSDDVDTQLATVIEHAEGALRSATRCCNEAVVV